MIPRRTFLQQAGAVASAAFVMPTAQPTSRYKMGLQLFTVRAPMRSDVAGTLSRIAALGYEEVETYGFDPAGLGYYGMPAKAFAQLLRDRGLSTPSGHYDLNRFAGSSADEMHAYVDRCIEGARALGQSYITWPVVDAPFQPLDRFKTVVERLNAVGERVAKGGLQFAYHNHGFEFVEQNGQLPYELVLKTDPALVKLQIDLYWLSHDSKQPAQYWFERAPGRYVMWHVKDMHKISRDYTELGNGTIDYTKIWPHASQAGMKHFFVEQGGNFTQDPMRSVEDGAAYVRRHLLKQP